MSLIFVARERNNWMRLQTHTVVFDREPDFEQYRHDPTGRVMRILHIWLAEPMPDTPVIRAYIGSVRFYQYLLESSRVAQFSGPRLSEPQRAPLVVAREIESKAPRHSGRAAAGASHTAALRFGCGFAALRGTWASRKELFRLFRRATACAPQASESGTAIRRRLSRFLREYFGKRP